MRRLSISNKLLVLVLAPLAAILVLAAIAFPLFQRVKVNGPEYRRIKSTQDLVADILPPPNYILETHFLAGQALLSEQPAFTQIRRQLTVLQKSYEERQAFWAQNLGDPELAKPFLRDSKNSAEAYFALLNAKFLPAMDQAFATGWSPQDQRSGSFVLNIAAGDADTVYREQLSPIYVSHRAAIDQTVALARAKQARLESNTAATVTRSGLLMTSLGALSLVLVALVGAAIRRSVRRPIAELTAAVNRASTETLPDVVAAMQTVGVDDPLPTIRPIVIASGDEMEHLATAFTAMQETAVAVASQQALARRNVSENLINLGRRNQALLGRTLALLTQLERSEPDPDKLDDLFRVDHLATRMRRNAESLLVLAGADRTRGWSEPIAMGDVVRAAVSAVESFERVDIVELEQVRVTGSAVADVAHLLAELIENATAFSAPDTRVAVIGKHVTEGYLLVVTDDGIGLTADDLATANTRIAETSAFDSAPTKVLGLNVVGRLASRYDIHVSLAPSATSGTAARVLIPQAILDGEAPEGVLPAGIAGLGAEAFEAPVHEFPGFDPSVFDPPGHSAAGFDSSGFDMLESDGLSAPEAVAGESAADEGTEHATAGGLRARGRRLGRRNKAVPGVQQAEVNVGDTESIPEDDSPAIVQWDSLDEVPVHDDQPVDGDALTWPEAMEELPRWAAASEDDLTPEASGAAEPVRSDSRRTNRLANLSRRVRGAQLPDTGPTLRDTEVHEREPEAVKSFLQSLQSGVSRGRAAEVTEVDLAEPTSADPWAADSEPVTATVDENLVGEEGDHIADPVSGVTFEAIIPDDVISAEMVSGSPVDPAPEPVLSAGRPLATRVRGAQMPDTGPVAEETQVLADPENVRSALSSLQAGLLEGRKAADLDATPPAAEADETRPSLTLRAQ